MDQRKKLVELLMSQGLRVNVGILADHLIANGVTIPQHGRWIGGYQQKNGQWFYEKPYCSVCGAKHDGVAPFCEKCGSIMDQKEG